MRKKWINYCLVVAAIFLYACEYEPEEVNRVELKKSENPAFDLRLNAPVNNKGEYILRYPHVKWTLENPSDYMIYSVRILKDIYGSVYWNNNGYLVFESYDGYGYPPSFSLKCEMILISDTAKSIAEIRGYEYLEKTYEWNFVCDPQIPELNLKCEKTGDKTYRLTWETPDPYYGEVDHYEVSVEHYYTWDFYSVNTNELFYDIELPDNTYGFNYRVSAYFKEGYLYPLSESRTQYLD